MKTVLLPNFYVGLLAFVEAGGSFFLGCKTLGWNEVTFEHIYVQEVKIAMSAGSRCTWFCVLVLNGGYTPCRWLWGSGGSFVLCGS